LYRRGESVRRSLSGKSNGGSTTLFQKSRPSSHIRRPIGGLTIEETIEFEAIDALLPFDDNGNIAWSFEGEPTTDREKRWLELYEKQLQARPLGK
jgi:hypothetical protein